MDGLSTNTKALSMAVTDSKDIRTYERDRQLSLKPADRTKTPYKHYWRGHYKGHIPMKTFPRVGEVRVMYHEAVNCIVGQNLDEGSADAAWEEDNAWSPVGARAARHQVDLLLIAKPARKKRRGPAKDFVMIPSVPRVRCLDENSEQDIDDLYEDWEVVCS